MLCPNDKQSQRRQSFKLILLQFLMLVHAQTTVGQTDTKTTANFVPHRYTSNNNITILHEVHETAVADKLEPIDLNIHEVLPLKPVKKKPYTLLDKAVIIEEYEKPRPLKEYQLHPVTFDFNLGDLEDLEEHESFKKGDLSAEEKHLLRNGNDEGLTYTESANEDADVDVEVDMSAITTTTENSTTTTTTTTSTSTTSTTTNTPLSSVVTVSPHIFKVLKNKTSKKGRELLQKDELQKNLGTHNFNSISHYFGSADSAADSNATAESLLQAANLFQIITNLYDHFYWRAADIRSKVTTGCALEMQAYLTALNGNYDWAQKAYDASGRYRGQIFFGNDKWLGQKAFCHELNRQLRPEERKHFQFEFYVAVVALRLWVPQKVEVNVQVGECLPKSCTTPDVRAMLTADPHAHMLSTLSSASNTTNSTHIQILRVRMVPGIFSFWRELKFQIFASFMLTLIFVVIVATWYQAKLNRRQLTSHIPAISAKVEAHMAAAHSLGERYNDKAFELYQMNTIGDNNNVVDIETMADVNGNKGQQQGQTNGHGAAESTCSKQIQADVDKTQMADYKLETGSSAGAGGTYEAKRQLGLHEQFLLCFAFQTNASSILNIDDNKESQTSCVHGLRVLSVLWTIMVHTYLQMFTIGENRFYRIIVERSIWYQFVGNATFSVDTFFFISGFLVTLLYLKQEKKYPEDRGQFVRRSFKDTVIILVYRYIRLTPSYLFVILLNDFSLRQTFDDSVFQPTVAPNTCEQFWWRNILYVNNFYPLSEICMIWSWYMANDMQFYIMASLLLVISTRYFKTAVLIVGTFLLSSWGVSGVISLHHHYTHKVSSPFESFDFLYDKPWQRVGTYIMGMIAGYIIYKVKTPPKVSNRTNLLLWAASFGLLGLIIFGVWEGELSVITTAFYVGIGHTAFGLGLMWMVLSCCWGLSPTVNRILSYRALLPLSRLTYCTYLIHPVIMLVISFRMTGTVHLNNLFVMTIFLGNAVVSFCAAFFISVLFEAPVIRLLKIIFRK